MFVLCSARIGRKTLFDRWDIAAISMIVICVQQSYLPKRCRNDVQLDDVRRDANSSTDGLRDESQQSGWHRFLLNGKKLRV